MRNLINFRILYFAALVFIGAACSLDSLASTQYLEGVSKVSGGTNISPLTNLVVTNTTTNVITNVSTNDITNIITNNITTVITNNITNYENITETITNLVTNLVTNSTTNFVTNTVTITNNK